MTRHPHLKLGQSGVIDHVLSLTVVIVAFGAIGTFILVRSNAATTCAKQTIGRGNAGQCVLDAQEMLNGFTASHVLHPSYSYYGTRLAPDSQFGNATYGQVRYFQGRFGIAVDGVVGNQTWTMLCYEMDHLPYGAVRITTENKQAAADVNSAYSGQSNSQCKP